MSLIPNHPPQAFEAWLRSEHHPESLVDHWQDFYAPLAVYLAELAGWGERPPVVGVNGCQGSGKSTLCDVMSWVLQTYGGLRVVVLSIDDLYFGHATRQQLGRDVHPLLQTRGVPGTHEVSLGVSTLTALTRNELPVAVPRFDKSRDDRLPSSDWPIVTEPADLILFEGWCVATTAQDVAELADPVNELEASEDAAGHWRRYVNEQLMTVYPALWCFLDRLIFLQAPSFECVQCWRWRQEQRLATVNPGGGKRIMTQPEVLRFIAYYQRLTQHNLATLPARCNVLAELDEQQRVDKVSWL